MPCHKALRDIAPQERFLKLWKENIKPSLQLSLIAGGYWSWWKQYLSHLIPNGSLTHFFTVPVDPRYYFTVHLIYLARIPLIYPIYRFVRTTTYPLGRYAYLRMILKSLDSTRLPVKYVYSPYYSQVLIKISQEFAIQTRRRYVKSWQLNVRPLELKQSQDPVKTPSTSRALSLSPHPLGSALGLDCAVSWFYFVSLHCFFGSST